MMGSHVCSSQRASHDDTTYSIEREREAKHIILVVHMHVDHQRSIPSSTKRHAQNTQWLWIWLENDWTGSISSGSMAAWREILSGQQRASCQAVLWTRHRPSFLYAPRRGTWNGQHPALQTCTSHGSSNYPHSPQQQEGNFPPYSVASLCNSLPFSVCARSKAQY